MLILVSAPQSLTTPNSLTTSVISLDIGKCGSHIYATVAIVISYLVAVNGSSEVPFPGNDIMMCVGNTYSYSL